MLNSFVKLSTLWQLLLDVLYESKHILLPQNVQIMFITEKNHVHGTRKKGLLKQSCVSYVKLQNLSEIL